MDARQFDRLTASLAATTRRRRFLALLAALPFAHALPSLDGVEEAGAARPLDRVQGHQSAHRKRARHRQDHRHKVKTRDNGKRSKVQGGSRACPDMMLKCCILESFCVGGCHGHKPYVDCGGRIAGEIGPVGTCWSWGRLECLPCADEKDLDRRCNETFPECAASPLHCHAKK